jgi:16S rRNA (cytosine1402-N4)-methyltransferase
MNLNKLLLKNFSLKNKSNKVLALDKIAKYQPIHFKDHYPVMWRNILNIIDENIYKTQNDREYAKVFGDFTLGCGNHTNLILSNYESAFVIGVDLDTKMIDYTNKKLNQFIKEDRLILVEENYVCVEDVQISELFDDIKLFPAKKKFDFILLDLGYNSMQLEDREKGISFKNPDSPLDMRYDLHNENKSKACDILNHSTEFELMEIFRNFADEKNFEALAKNIIKQRDIRRFETVGDFLKVIDQTFSNETKDKFNTYTRLFQSLRITVNFELVNLQRFLNKVLLNLELNGILAVISFHSTEDKYMKNVIKEWENLEIGKSVFKHGIKPCDIELEENSRSKSAILRAFKFSPNIPKI